VIWQTNLKKVAIFSPHGKRFQAVRLLPSNGTVWPMTELRITRQARASHRLVGTDPVIQNQHDYRTNHLFENAVHIHPCRPHRRPFGGGSENRTGARTRRSSWATLRDVQSIGDSLVGYSAARLVVRITVSPVTTAFVQRSTPTQSSLNKACRRTDQNVEPLRQFKEPPLFRSDGGHCVPSIPRLLVMAMIS